MIIGAAFAPEVLSTLKEHTAIQDIAAEGILHPLQAAHAGTPQGGRHIGRHTHGNFNPGHIL